jgi:hypothetical protein
MSLPNYERQYINKLLASSERYYRLFKAATTTEIKRKAGLRHLQINAEIRAIYQRYAERPRTKGER